MAATQRGGLSDVARWSISVMQRWPTGPPSMTCERDDRMTVYDDRKGEVAAHPDREARALWSDDERYKVLVAWNETYTAYPRDVCVPQLVAERAASAPEALALVAGDGRLTYRELEVRSNQIAHYLRARG